MASLTADQESTSSGIEELGSDIDAEEEAKRVAELLRNQDDDEYVNEVSLIDRKEILGVDEDFLPQNPVIARPDAVHEILNFHGAQVTLPYKANESQKEMLDVIIDSVLAHEKKNVLLESPAGTGKTVALLCGPLAAFKHLEDTKGAPKKVKFDAASQHQLVYACRTSNQMQAVIKQLRKTIYKDTPMTVLEGRRRICLNKLASPSGPGPADRSGGKKNKAKNLRKEVFGQLNSVLSDEQLPKDTNDWCRILRDPPTVVGKNGRRQRAVERCTYYDKSKISDFPQSFLQGRVGLFDIEDIIKGGKDNHVCPYYALREMKKEARLIICTHNHLLDPFLRKASDLEITDKTTIVFDEAHNIEERCRQLGSTHLKGQRVKKLYQAITNIQEFHEAYKQIHRILLTVFTNFREWLQDEQNSDRPMKPPYQGCDNGEGKREIGAQIFDVLGRMGLTKNQSKEYFMTVKNQLTRIDENIRDARFCDDLLGGFFNIMWLCKTLYDSMDQGNFNDYTILLVRREVNRSLKLQLAGIDLKVICNNPQRIFKPLKDAHTIIVASGTLSPLDSFSSELGVQFHHSRSIPHVISKDRVFAALIRQHQHDKPHLQLTRQFLKDNLRAAASQLADIVHDVCVTVPYGVLVYFPSDEMMKKILREWYDTGALAKLKKVKRIYEENKNDDIHKIRSTIKDYRSAAKSYGGALLFAVMRGHTYEGVDFGHEEARAVITVGIPFDASSSDIIEAKRKYNDTKGGNHPNGSQWYERDALRALNQALGKCVRHVNDWGLIFMVDSRLTSEKSYRMCLPGWLKENIEENVGTPHFTGLKDRIQEFVASK